MSDGFLARWSRRKRDEARRPPEVAPEAAPAEPAAPPVADDEASLSPEELAQLPSLDALTAATDLTPFLRAGVPRALRNAALRRMWSVDPAIRDFVSEARDYAYDWNTPGGVPGTEGLISAEEVRAMVERVFGAGEETKTPDTADDDGVNTGSPSLLWGRGAEESAITREGDTVPIEARGVVLAAGRPELHPAPSPPSPLPLSHTLPRSQAGLESPGEGIPRHTPDHRDPGADPAPSPPSPPRLRRHGGALPI